MTYWKVVGTYPFPSHVRLLEVSLLHAGTENAENIQIITTSAQKVDNVIPTLDRLLSTIRVGVIKTAGNIGIYCPSVFCVRSRPNQ